MKRGSPLYILGKKENPPKQEENKSVSLPNYIQIYQYLSRYNPAVLAGIFLLPFLFFVAYSGEVIRWIPILPFNIIVLVLFLRMCTPEQKFTLDAEVLFKYSVTFVTAFISAYISMIFFVSYETHSNVNPFQMMMSFNSSGLGEVVSENPSGFIVPYLPCVSILFQAFYKDHKISKK